MSKNKRLQKPIAIAVEGADWFYLLLNQIKNQSEFEDIQLFDFGGTSQLGSFLSLLRRDRKFKQLKALGIMRDAELDRDAAVASLQTTLRQAGFAAPDAQNQISTTPVPAVAYLVIPHLNSVHPSDLTNQNFLLNKINIEFIFRKYFSRFII